MSAATTPAGRTFNYCRGATGAPSQGGSRRANKMLCPVCRKSVTINRDGRTRAHGVWVATTGNAA